MFRVIVYWCIMMLSALFVLMSMPSLIETLFDVDALPNFLPLCSLMVSALGMCRAVFILWRAGGEPTPKHTVHQDYEIDVKHLPRNGVHPPAPNERLR